MIVAMENLVSESAFHTQAVQILGEVMLAAEHDRDQKLDKLCGSNVVLKAEVTSLLDAALSVAAGTGRPPARVLVEGAGRGSPLPGDIPGYTLTGVLGEGSSGVVYLGEQLSPRRLVAVKVLRAGLVGNQSALRLVAEAQVLASLDHPGIVRVIESGICTESELPYIVMEYCGGRPLSRVLSTTGLDPVTAVELLIQLCRCVHYAHRSGIVHRDIKASNILTQAPDDAGRPLLRVIDFGLAKHRLGDAKSGIRTLDQGLIGSLAYMSPERFSSTADPDWELCDVYAIGVVALLMLGCASERDLVRCMGRAHELLGRNRGRLTRPMRRILAGMLHPDPARRRRDLERIARELTRTRGRVARSRRSTRGIGSLAALLLVVAVAKLPGRIADTPAPEPEASRDHQPWPESQNSLETSLLANDFPSAAIEAQLRRAFTLRESGKYAQADRIYQALLVRDDLTKRQQRWLHVDASINAREGGYTQRGFELAKKGVSLFSPEEMARRDTFNHVVLLWREFLLADQEHLFPVRRSVLAERARSLDLLPLERARVLQLLAGAYFLEGEFAAAERIYLEILGITDSVAVSGDDQKIIVECWNSRGVIAKSEGRMDEALNFFDGAIEAAMTFLGELHPRTQAILTNRLSVQYNLRRFTRCRENAEIVLLRARDLEGDPEHVGIARAMHGMALCALGELEEGEQELRSLLTDYEYHRPKVAPQEDIWWVFIEAWSRARLRLNPGDEDARSRMNQAQDELRERLGEDAHWVRAFTFY